MQNRSSVKFYPLLFLALSIVVIFLSIRSASLPDPVKANSGDTVFSAQRAYEYLQQIAQAPHSIGTAEHDKVRDFIVTTCQQLGLTVRVQHSVITRKQGNNLIAASVYNIIASSEGTMAGKAIVNIAHYDSQPNTPGAADDGMGVASMLETARAIKLMHHMKNDVVFLFTDGEEQGLLGAKAFIDEDSLAKNIGVAMNWDFRGNRGVTITYETSKKNGWLMRQYAKGSKYPLANSMGFEISRRMPNDVDFSMFQEAGITGYTSGLLGGFSYYHTLGDNVKNIDLKSMQQVGDNMLGMVKELGDASLENTKAPNLSYFNIYGYWFIYYPSSLNIFFIILVTLLFAIVIIKAFRDKRIKPAVFIIGAIALPVTLAASYFISSFLLKWIIKKYPLYTHFYENNSYNSSWYFLAMMMLGLFLFSLIYQPVVRKWNYASVFGGILFFCCGCMWLAFRYTPSASWLLSFPLLFLLAGFGWMIRGKKEFIDTRFRFYLISFVSILPTLLLFAPITYFIFQSFGLSNKLPVATTFIVLIAALSFPVLSNVFKAHRMLLPVLCFAAMLVMLFTAHLSSKYNNEQPLQTNVEYELNATDSTASWVSEFLKTDKYSDKFFANKQISRNKKHSPILINPAPVLSFVAPMATVKKDTIINNERQLTLFCQSLRSGSNTMGITIDDSTLQSIVGVDITGAKHSGNDIDTSSSIHNIIYYGASVEGFEVVFTMKPNSKLSMQLYDQSMGLPEIKNLTALPPDVIPSPGFRSNTTRVIKDFLW